MKEELRTLQEQQAEAWRLAPDDAEWIAQDGDGEWFGYFDYKPYQIKGAWDRPYSFACFFGKINGWDWRDTLQSRKEFEEMKPSELEKANGDHKEGFVPEIGQECLINGNGLTKREHYAGIAMMGLLASGKFSVDDEMAKESWGAADALLLMQEKLKSNKGR